MPTRKFRELLEAMPADRQRRIERRFQDSLTAMPLDQLRKAQEMTQLQMAEILGVGQGEVSKISMSRDTASTSACATMLPHTSLIYRHRPPCHPLIGVALLDRAACVFPQPAA